MEGDEQFQSTEPALTGGTSNTPVESGATSVLKKCKPMKPRSDVWRHFEKFKNDLGELRARYKYCKRDYSGETTNGTSGLATHVRNCKVHNLASNQTKISFQSSSEEGVSLQNWIYDKDLCSELYTKMIIVDELPFKFGDNMGFQDFMKGVCPMFRIPSRFKVARDFFSMYVSRRDGLMKALCDPTQRICLTTDTWTSNQKINYMCLTGHFIDKNWTLHKRILNFCPITSHKGESIGLAIELCLRDWEITRVLSCTVDNASSNDVAMGKLKEKMSTWPTSIMDCEFIHMRCVAHILNLIVQDGLSVYNESIDKVRSAVKYVRHSSQRTTRFEKCVDFENIECKKDLILDVPTRWNSTYEMLEVAEKYEKAFYRYDEQDLGYCKVLKFQKKGIEGEFDGRPTSYDWIVVRKFAFFLEVFYDLTMKISGTSYVTSNLFFHEIYTVYSILHTWILDIHCDMYEMGEKMLKKFNKYWGDPKKMNKYLFLSVVLDPRHKLPFLVYMLKDMYGGEVGGIMGKDIEETLSKMFNEYKSKMGMNNDDNNSRENMLQENVRLIHPSLRLRLQFEMDSGMVSHGVGCSDLDEYLSESQKSSLMILTY